MASARSGHVPVGSSQAFAIPTNPSDMPSRTAAIHGGRGSPGREERLQPHERDRHRDGQPWQRELRRAFDRKDGQGDRDGEQELWIALESNGQPRRGHGALDRIAVAILEEEARGCVPLRLPTLRGARGLAAPSLGGGGVRAGRRGVRGDTRRGGVHAGLQVGHGPDRW